MTGIARIARPRLEAVGQRWRSFWFAPQPMYTLGLLRAAFAALVMLWALWLIPMRHGLLEADGVTPAQPSVAHTWDVFAVWNSDEAVVIGIALLLVSAVALLVGWHSRIAAIVVFVLVLSFERRFPWGFNSGDALVRIEALLIAISPCGTALSLDQRRSTGSFWSAQTRPNWPIRLFQVQLSLIYLAAVTAKLPGASWLQGTAVSYVLRIEDMRRVPLPHWFVTDALAMNALTWGTLAVELALGILVWIPRCRPWVLAAGILMHLFIDVFIQIGIFSYAMFVMYVAWVSPETARTLPDRRRQLPWRRDKYRGLSTDAAVTSTGESA